MFKIPASGNVAEIKKISIGKKHVKIRYNKTTSIFITESGLTESGLTEIRFVIRCIVSAKLKLYPLPIQVRYVSLETKMQ